MKWAVKDKHFLVGLGAVAFNSGWAAGRTVTGIFPENEQSVRPLSLSCVLPVTFCMFPTGHTPRWTREGTRNERWHVALALGFMWVDGVGRQLWGPCRATPQSVSSFPYRVSREVAGVPEGGCGNAGIVGLPVWGLSLIHI